MADDLAASSAIPSPPDDDTYPALLASVRARFTKLTEGAAGKPILFTTSAAGLYPLFLDALPEALRKPHECSACRKFVEHYGALVTIDPKGEVASALWSQETTPEPFVKAIRALASAVTRAPVTSVFLSHEKVWGTPVKGAWEHFAVTPADVLTHKPSPLKTTSQVVAEVAHDHETLLRGLAEFPREIVEKAFTMLTHEALYRSESCLGVARWLLDLHNAREKARSDRARDALTWLATARAPAGFCHVRSTMIGTLLEDLAAGMPFAEIKARFGAKMNPLQYQRPTAAPRAGNIAEAEKIVATLRSAGALERRFARLADIQTLWRPKGPAKALAQGGVFGHLKARGSAPADVEMPPVTMTWEKFARTVLPTAEGIEFLIPTTNSSYIAMVTAKNPEAPPILQWDLDSERNPVSWYMYVNGSEPARWNLTPGVYHPVTTIALQPSMWHPNKSFDHQGAKVVFILEGARDLKYTQGCGFFPEFLRSEYHPIRATMEAYAKSAVVDGKDEAEACGIGLQKGQSWNHSFRVTSAAGARVSYKLDRWD